MELQVANPKKLKLNPDNPRRTKASPEADAQLTANIKAIGLIQPPIVREQDGKLVVIAGDRRVKCSIAAGLTEIHVLVTKHDDNADPLRALAENVQRAQMGPVDQWRAIEGLCGSGWSEDAIGVAFSMPVRTIRKLRLLASILPAMLDRMAHDLPREDELRKITAAPLDKQEAVWKTHKPKRGHDPEWHAIARALHKARVPATAAKFDEEIARTYGVRWEDDLFGPADKDNRTTTDVEQFFAAQQHWLETTLPENGVILETESWGGGKLPPRAERTYGQPREGDQIGFFIDQRTGEVGEIPFRIPERPTAGRTSGNDAGDSFDQPKTPRPEISKKGVEQIGDLRTDALHQGLREAPIDDTKLLGLLVLAFAALNIRVESAADRAFSQRFGSYSAGGARSSIARRLIEGGHLTSDLDVLRTSAREMLVQVLSCREGLTQSGVVARVAGDVIGADAFLPNMADEEFLKTLSKGGIENAIRGLGLAPRNTGKEMRAALLEHVGQGHYVLPGACFALQADELSELQKRIAQDRAPPVSNETLGDDEENGDGEGLDLETDPDAEVHGEGAGHLPDGTGELRSAA